jgi:hypothetical protein
MNPNNLKKELLENASTEHQKQFAEMLAKQCAIHDLQATGHRCWFFIPSPTEYEKMKKYQYPNNKCPKCKGKSNLVVEIYRGNIGDSWNVVCREKGCDFKEYISDDE